MSSATRLGRHFQLLAAPIAFETAILLQGTDGQPAQCRDGQQRGRDEEKWGFGAFRARAPGPLL
jgi:hypothetical protein